VEGVAVSLKGILVKVADYSTSRVGGALLKSLGLGLFTTAAILTLVNQWVDYAVNKFNGLLPDLLSIMALASFPEGLSIITGFIVIKATLIANKVHIGKGATG
jgi:hypothetical protein